MAALDQIRSNRADFPEAAAKAWIRSAFWAWFDANENDEVAKVGVWKLHKTIHLRDLQHVFERFFGPRQVIV